MTTDDFEAFKKLLAMISVQYQRPILEMGLDMYWTTLEHLPFETVKKGFYAHLCNADTGQYMPNPADVLKEIRGGSSQACALKAWSQVSGAIRDASRYDSVVFDDALIHAVLEEMGGWIRLCKATERELTFLEKDFEKRYIAYSSHPPARYPAKLIGVVEHHNRCHGYALPAPTLIGDPEKALAVFQGGTEKPALMSVKTLAAYLPALANPATQSMSSLQQILSKLYPSP